MKATISLQGWGLELSVGTIPQEVWNYIQEECDGDFEEYLDNLDNGDVPEDLRLADDRCSMYECNDLYNSSAGKLDECTIVIEDEDGNELFSAEGNNDLKDKGVKVEKSYDDINRMDDSTRYATVYVSDEKGTFLTGEFEIEGDFDPEKLTVSCEEVEMGYCKGTEQYYFKYNLVTGFKYDGNDIVCDFAGSRGVGIQIDMVQKSCHVDEYGNKCEIDTSTVIVYGTSEERICSLPVKKMIETAHLTEDGYIEYYEEYNDYGHYSIKIPEFFEDHYEEEDLEIDEFNNFLRCSDGDEFIYLLDKDGNRITAVKDFDHSEPGEDGYIYYSVPESDLEDGDPEYGLTKEAIEKWKVRLGME